MFSLIPLSSRKHPHDIGQKANSLHWLAKRGFTIPQTYLLAYEAYAFFLADQAQFRQILAREIGAKLDLTHTFAVRSSANVEDSYLHSFAGQLASILCVTGPDNIIDAVIEVYQSIQSSQLAPYLEQMALASHEIQIAVIIQEMVEPQVSGVVFSKNPITGLDEMLVEAVSGSGEQLMQEGITPERWVYKWGDWKEQPRNPQFSPLLMSQVITGAKSITKAYGSPLDLEWVFDGQTLYWLQLRPITALAGQNIYSNRISREVLPGLIKPLVWSINVPLVNGAWIALFTELIGPNKLRAQDLSKAFHYRAYFNMSAIGQVLTAIGLPAETLELMLGLEGGHETPSFRPTWRTMRHLPRLLRFAVAKIRYERELKRLIPAMQDALHDFERNLQLTAGEAAILEQVDALFPITQKVAYANIVTPLLMHLYNALLKRSLAQRNIDYLQLDLSWEMVKAADYTPSQHLEALHQQFLALDESTQSQILASTYAQFQEMESVASFQAGVAAFIEHFGHLSDSGNDFSTRSWRETPALVLQMIAGYAGADAVQEESLTWDSLPLGQLDRWRWHGLFQRARRFLFYREAVSFLYTYGYSLFRQCFMAIGQSFTARSLIEQPTDIFYLYYDEIRTLVAAGPAAESQMAKVGCRKEEIELARPILLPDIIYGEQDPPLELYSKDISRLTGIATSPGYYQGPVRVVHSVDEYHDVHEGDILVIPFSDISWTPLFSKAGAIVAESGGILSHSSIVAREHKLPAVVSVTNACQLLQNDMIVLVDGYKGEIMIPDSVSETLPRF